MRRPSRIRRWFKRGGVTVCVLVLMMWVFSIWGQINWVVPVKLRVYLVGFGHQQLYLGQTASTRFSPVGWDINWHANLLPVFFMPFLSIINKAWIVYLPLWIPFLLVAFPTAFLFWRDRRIPQGHCKKCRYDLTGNTTGVCPECGTKIDEPAERAQLP